MTAVSSLGAAGERWNVIASTLLFVALSLLLALPPFMSSERP
jgi:hypothetical protein